MKIITRLVDAFFASRHVCSNCGDPLPEGVVGAEACCSDECADDHLTRTAI